MYKEIYKLFSRSERIKLATTGCIQILLAFLDLLGVALIGLVGALSIYGIQSKNVGERVYNLLELLQIEEFSFQNQVAVVAAMAAFVLVAKTLFSLFLTKKTLWFISNIGAGISSNIVKSLLSQNLGFVNSFKQQELIYSISTGVDVLTTRVIGTSISVFTDIFLAAVLFTGLLFVDPFTSVTVLGIFGLIGFVLLKILRAKAFNLGSDENKIGVQSNQLIWEVLNTFREATVRNRRYFYAHKIRDLRYELSHVTASRQFMLNINKYVMEITLVLGALILTAVQFSITDATHAIAKLAIFLAAASRIAPAILRVQQGYVSINSGLGTADKTLTLINEIRISSQSSLSESDPDFKYTNFHPILKIENLNFSYGSNFGFKNLSIEIAPGEHVALVGPSGAGKSTLIDLMLGIIEPDAGSVRISGMTPIQTFHEWPGACAYVPQEIVIVPGTFLENITLGFDPNFKNTSMNEIWQAVRISGLEEFVESLPNKLNTDLGEKGFKLSGGQKQRLGIARAFYTNPKLIILDEATSALDSETENKISTVLSEFRGKITLITIAHRLSTIVNADKVYYLESGKIIASGKFEDVRRKVPNFDKQAQLMGM